MVGSGIGGGGGGGGLGIGAEAGGGAVGGATITVGGEEVAAGPGRGEVVGLGPPLNAAKAGMGNNGGELGGVVGLAALGGECGAGAEVAATVERIVCFFAALIALIAWTIFFMLFCNRIIS